MRKGRLFGLSVQINAYSIVPPAPEAIARARDCPRSNLGTERAGEQGLDRFIHRGETRDHDLHGLRDRHVDTAGCRQFHHGARGIDALGDREALIQHFLDAPSFAELDAERHVARLRAAAGEHEIAEARESGQRLASRAEPNLVNSANPRVTSAACALAPSFLPATMPAAMA